MDNTTRLFWQKTKQDWIDLRNKILANPNDPINWQEVVDLLDSRLETRYFKPIERILKMSPTNGEGFAAMALICSLIEFLQSCYEGKTYENGLKKETKLKYGASGSKFKAFLEQHPPFKPLFTKSLAKQVGKAKTFADDFYINVRCGLLHEAATKNNWLIKVEKGSTDFVDLSNESNKIIYRDQFVQAIRDFVKDYKSQIMNNEQDLNKRYLRDSICRKFDALCEVVDTAPKWWQI